MREQSSQSTGGIRSKDEILEHETAIISCSSVHIMESNSEHGIHGITNTSKRTVQDTKTIHTPASPTMICSTSRSTTIPTSENFPPFSNARLFKREMYYDIFKEDDDWNIYQPGFVITKTKSLLESEPSFERQINELQNDEAKISLDSSSCQKESPSTKRGIRYSQTDNFVNNGGTFREWKTKGMLRMVEKFFLENPVQVPNNLGHLEREMCITTTPYFSRDFALRHGMTPFTFSSILQTSLPKDPSKVSKLFLAYEEISSLGLSEKDFFHYIGIDEQRRDCVWNGSSYLDPSTISELDILQEHVGKDIFDMIYEKLRTDEQSRALLRNPELLNYVILFWNSCKESIDLGEEPTAIEYNKAQSTSDVVTEDIYFSGTNADFRSTASGSGAIKTLHLDDLSSDSFSEKGTPQVIFGSGTNGDFRSTASGSGAIKTLHLDDLSSDSFSEKGTPQVIFGSGTNADFRSTASGSGAIKTLHLDDLSSNSYADDRKEEFVKNRQYSKDLLKVQSVKPIDNLETELKCSPKMQSTDEESKENINRKSRTSKNNATHSSAQTFKGKSKDGQSEKLFKALENVSKVQPRVRKYSSQDNKAKSSKKIRFEENTNFG